MEHSTEFILEDIQHVSDLAKEAVEGLDAHLFQEYTTQLDEITPMYKDHVSPEVRDGLITCWLPYIQYVTTKSSSPFLHIARLNTFIALSAENSYITKPDVPFETKKLIVLTCMLQTASLVEKGLSKSPSNNAGALLSQWSKQPLDENTVSSVENLVNYFYGQSVWMLCRGDVSRDHLFPQYLWKHNIPMLPEFVEEQLDTQQTIIPTDIA